MTKITPALQKLDTLEFKQSSIAPMFDIGVRKYRGSFDRSDLDFQIGISAAGIEATRNVSIDDLIEIRDWINQAIEASKTEGG